ncbi:MAG: MarR family winged helix-turn-helix transcriptional regulator [Actinomycetota bacterium]|nr:MarR family winged helix-turn-helix transcriptional regulator [Actinomycetota bacterium]
MNFDEADALNESIRAVGIRHRALAIAALAPFGIHPGHKLLLMELDKKGPVTQAHLAAASGYEPPTITMSVRQLEAAGLVVRRPSAADRRATLVELSDLGRAVLPKVRTAWRHVAEQTTAGLSPAQVMQAKELFPALAAALTAAVDPTNLPRYAPPSRPR